MRRAALEALLAKSFKMSKKCPKVAFVLAVLKCQKNVKKMSSVFLFVFPFSKFLSEIVVFAISRNFKIMLYQEPPGYKRQSGRSNDPQ